MARLQAFCIPGEAFEWVSMVMQQYQTPCLVFDKREECGRWVEDVATLSADATRIFLTFDWRPTAAISLSSFRPRDIVTIDITLGLLDTAALTITDVTGEVTSGGDDRAAKAVQWLRRKLKRMGVLYSPVVGVNVVYGGASVYRDIYFTKKAELIRQQGLIWKVERSDNAVFSPLVE